MQITDNILAISCNAVDVKDLMSAEQRSNEEINRTLKSTGFYKLSSFRGLKINEVFRKICFLMKTFFEKYQQLARCSHRFFVFFGIDFRIDLFIDFS